MEFATTQSFVKSLEGVYSSGVLEDPVKADVKVMIDMAYENGTINQSLEYMNGKYDYYMVRNMHQLFLQITNEGSKDASESLENMSQDIDMLVESVYRRLILGLRIIVYKLCHTHTGRAGHNADIDFFTLTEVAGGKSAKGEHEYEK